MIGSIAAALATSESLWYNCLSLYLQGKVLLDSTDESYQGFSNHALKIVGACGFKYAGAIGQIHQTWPAVHRIRITNVNQSAHKATSNYQSCYPRSASELFRSASTRVPRPLWIYQVNVDHSPVGLHKAVDITIDKTRYCEGAEII